MKDGSRRWTPQEKLELVLGSYQTDNVREYSREKDIDRSYLYQLRREHERSVLAAWTARKVGRPSKVTDQPRHESLEQLKQRCRELEAQLWSWKIQAELGLAVVDLLRGAAIFEEPRVKKKLSRRLRRWLSERSS